MESPSNILALFQQLRGRGKVAQETAAKSLADLSGKPGGAAAILRSGADLALLAARAEGGRSCAARFQCLRALGRLAVSEAGRRAVVAAGGIAAAVALLRTSNDAALQLYAAGLLRTLASSSDEQVPAMVDAGAFEALTGVLRRSSLSGVLEQVGSALCNATADGRSPKTAAAAMACIAAGAHTELLRQLSSGGLEAEAKQALAAATRALCMHARGKAAVVEAGGLDVLARCLSDGSTGVQAEAAGVLMNLAYAGGKDHCAGAVASHLEALPGLAALLKSRDEKVQACASSAIGNILLNSPESSSALVASSVLPGMVHLLQHSSDPEQLGRTVEHITMLAAREPDVHAAAVAAGAIPALQRLCDSADADVSEAAAGALEKLDAGQAKQQRPHRVCAAPGCGATRGLRRCGGCGAVRYCSEACSRAHWREHRADCRRVQAERQAAG